MVIMLSSSEVHCGLEVRSNRRQLNWYICSSTMPTALNSKSKDWLAQNLDNVSEWHMSTHRLLFQCQSGTTCLPTDCCFSVRVAQHVYPQTVVSVSEWHNMSTHRLLFQCQSGTTCLPTDCCFSGLAL